MDAKNARTTDCQTLFPALALNGDEQGGRYVIKRIRQEQTGGTTPLAFAAIGGIGDHRGD